jgi:hypothetical protein
MDNVFNVYSRSLPCIYFVLGESTMLIMTGERGTEWGAKGYDGT